MFKGRDRAVCARRVDFMYISCFDYSPSASTSRSLHKLAISPTHHSLHITCVYIPTPDPSPLSYTSHRPTAEIGPQPN